MHLNKSTNKKKKKIASKNKNVIISLNLLGDSLALEIRGTRRKPWILRTTVLHSRETCCRVDDRKFKRRMLS